MFDFKALFVEDLGWDKHAARSRWQWTAPLLGVKAARGGTP
jgi:hypothetical protein